MSKDKSNNVQKIVSAFVLWCMVAGSIVGVFSTNASSGNIPQPVPMLVPSEIVGTTFEIRDWGTYDADFSIYVNNSGTLRIVNSTLNFLQDDGTDYFIQVNSGNLILENSTITTGATPQAMWDPMFDITMTDAKLEMTRNSVLAFPGRLDITNTLTYINDSWITSLGQGSVPLNLAWATNFPTFYGVVDDWWAGTDRDIATFDSQNDGPIMTFTDCGNVTIADSRIDELYEDAGQSSTQDIQIIPSGLFGIGDGAIGDISALDNARYSLNNTENITVSFTSALSDMDYEILDLYLYVAYNNPDYFFSTGTNVTPFNCFNYSVIGSVPDTVAFQILWNQTLDIVREQPITLVDSFSQINDMNVNFTSYERTGDGFDPLNINIIALNLTIQTLNPSQSNVITVDNTSMTVINSYVNVDWTSFQDSYETKNAFNLINGSNLYMYNLSIEDDVLLDAVPDFEQIPTGANADDYVPFRVEAGSEAYYFKWLETSVTDKYDLAAQGATVNATFRSTDPAVVDLVSSINDLSGDADNEWASAKLRMTDYLGIAPAKFNVTMADGKAMLPLLTTFYNAANYPNGDPVGEYDIKVNYTRNAIKYWGNTTCEFIPVPNIAPLENSVSLDIQLTNLALPRPIGSPGMVVNVNTGDVSIGNDGPIETLTINDFLVVEDSATLRIFNTTVQMTESGTAPYEIIVRDNGRLILENVTLTSSTPILINLQNNARLIMNYSSVPSSIMAYDNTNATFNNAMLGGRFDTDPDANVRLWAVSTTFSQSLDQFHGTSNASLIGCIASSAFRIEPSESAKVWVYRWVEITVVNGLATPTGLANAEVWISTTTNPELKAILNKNGTTDSTGMCKFPVLSDYVCYDSTHNLAVSTPYNNYNVKTNWQGFTMTHTNTISLGLPTYTLYQMGPVDATAVRSIALENVLPDLDPPIIIWPTGPVGRGNEVLINSTVTNTGDAVATGTTVLFEDTFNGQTSEIFTTYNASLAPGESWDISFPYTWTDVADIGQHNITVRVDPDNTTKEQNEFNNTNFILINVTPQSDLAIRQYSDVWASVAYPLINEEFTLYANVWNLGDVVANNVVVSFYRNGTVLLGSRIANISANPAVPTVVSIPVTIAQEGAYNILVIIDELDLIPEVNENNNNNSLWPMVLRAWEFPDLHPTLTVWPPLGANSSVGRGNLVWINSTISNNGDATAYGTTVWFEDEFDGDISSIYTDYNVSLAPGEIWNISFAYTWDSVNDIGEHYIIVTVDPADDIMEKREDNNSNSILVNITKQPDLAILQTIDVSSNKTYPLINEELTLFAKIWNLGDIDATNVSVSFYQNGTLLGNVIAPLVRAIPSVSTEVSIRYTFTQNGTYNILVVIDELDQISEVNENNNNNSLWPLVLRVWAFPNLNIQILQIIEGANEAEAKIGGGTPITETYNRTHIILRARVHNQGELFASSVFVRFYEGAPTTANLIGTSLPIPSISKGSFAYVTLPWEAMTDGLQQDHTYNAIAYANAGLVSNQMSSSLLTVYDNRADIELGNVTLANNATNVVGNTAFSLNVSVTNNGLWTAQRFAVDVYLNMNAYNISKAAWNLGNKVPTNRLGNATIPTLLHDETVTVTIRCTGIDTGDHNLFVFVDTDLNNTDVIEYDDTTRLVGNIEEYGELNNNRTFAITALMPPLRANIQLPAPTTLEKKWTNEFTEGTITTVLITGFIVRVDNPSIGVPGIQVNVVLTGGTPVTVITGAGGFFTTTLPAPAVGNYTVSVSGDGIEADTTWFRIIPADSFPWWIIIVIIVLVVAVIVGITLYLYFVGLGKTVQCGECSAFIPEGAAKCPKCGVEFETEVAKCSVCGAWVPIDVKNCPECKTEFTVGTEDLDDYEAKMKRQYDDIVRKFRDQAKTELGQEFTETEFQAWWASKPTFITFDLWLKEEEEMKRMGARPCPVCETENSVTAKICHKCGSVMGPAETTQPKKPEGKLPPTEKKPDAKPTTAQPKQQPPASQPVAPQPQRTAAPPQQAAPQQVAPQATAPVPAQQGTLGKKSCPSCGMEVNVAEKVCPICNFDFGDQTQAGGATRIIRKPIKKVVRRPMGEGGDQQQEQQQP